MRRETINTITAEQDVARFWWSLPPGCPLTLSDGLHCKLLYAGRPGGPAGPDVRDAVLLSADMRLCGDVEFHLRASDWLLHQHHYDPRYNNVILHIVHVADNPRAAIRQDGVVVPFCSIGDIPRSSYLQTALSTAHAATRWPCQQWQVYKSPQDIERRLYHAGVLRFEHKTANFVEQLHQLVPSGDFDPYDECLIPALAEALGYGRDRAFFHAVGLYLVRKQFTVPEPLGRALAPSPLDEQRLHALAELVTHWRIPGIWRTIRALCTPQRQSTTRQGLTLLRNALCQFGLSLARTDILICNVLLPFVAAVALIEQQPELAHYAQELYLRHPGLSSNAITRMMSAQLLLAHEPRGSCQQQGLHFVYQQTCREKRCNICLFGKKDV